MTWNSRWYGRQGLGLRDKITEVKEFVEITTSIPSVGRRILLSPRTQTPSRLKKDSPQKLFRKREIGVESRRLWTHKTPEALHLVQKGDNEIVSRKPPDDSLNGETRDETWKGFIWTTIEKKEKSQKGP